MLGQRPGAGDFGLFGQLSQLVGFDPTSREIAHAVSPRTVGWVDKMPDGSGLMPEASDWIAVEDQPASLRGLLSEIGRVYTPAQLANAQARDGAGEDLGVRDRRRSLAPTDVPLSGQVLAMDPRSVRAVIDH